MPSKLTFTRDYFCLDDQLGFDRYVTTLADMITDENFNTPFCIGIHGPWGSGKTSFMRQLEAALSQTPHGTVVVPLWFNPWRYSKEEHLIIPFLKTISAALSAYQQQLNDDADSQLGKKLSQAASDISDAARAIAYGVKLNFFGLALSGKDMVEREQQIQEEHRDELTTLTQDLPAIYYSIIEHLQKAVEDSGIRLVVFIDDLDRCLPEKAVELLEAIKLFLDLEGYLFILGVDRAVVEEGIRQHYQYDQHTSNSPKQNVTRTELAGKYLEKMIQMELELPPVEPSRKRGFINSLLGNSSLTDHIELIEHGISGRPRDITRFINYLAFFCRLAEKLRKDLRKEPKNSGKPDNWLDLLETYFKPEFYLKWAIFIFSYRADYLQTSQVTSYFFKLQSAARQTDRQQADNLDQQDSTQLAPGLDKVLSYGRAFAEDPWLIRTYVHLADSVSDIMIDKAPAEKSRRQLGKAGSLPAIGEMVSVSRGPFFYGEEKESRNIEEDFEIDVYPVTNAQFCRFLKERYPGDQTPNDGQDQPIIDLYFSKIHFADTFSVEKEYEDHPVTGVTWYGAVKFCSWRTETEGINDTPYRLPTELEWEKAARGDNGNEYPWGNEFVSENCNTSESQSEGTTAVTKYPEGHSPYGCFDMAGNVWEWTSDNYNNGSKVLRGGSWGFARSAARCAFRDRVNPGDRGVNVGFRCARTKKVV